MKIGWLIALNIWAIACTLNPLYVNVSDRSPFLRMITEPEEWIRPWGPPLLLMLLFAMLGSSTRKSKLFARMGAALLLYVALFWVMMGYGFSGNFVVVEYDWPILLGCSGVAAILGAWGFSRDPAILSEQE